MRVIALGASLTLFSSCLAFPLGAMTVGLAFHGEADRYAEGAARERRERAEAAQRAAILRERYRASEATGVEVPPALSGQALSAPPLIASEPARKPLKPTLAR